MELHRGQHPHRKAGGSWDIRTRTFRSSGPEAWDDKGEIERARWDECFAPELEAGSSPFAQPEVRGGLDADTHARLKRLDKMAKAGGADEVAWQNSGTRNRATLLLLYSSYLERACAIAMQSSPCAKR